MHLLVLSAFRPDEECMKETLGHVSMHLLVLSAFRQENSHDHHLHPPRRLNAPSGAQCFPTSKRTMLTRQDYLSQCTFWCSVLSDVASRYGHRPSRPGSQCTFWCSALSDS